MLLPILNQEVAMYIYYIYPKVQGVLKTIKVSAESERTSDKELCLYKDKKVIAEFRLSEILGWVKVLKDAS